MNTAPSHARCCHHFLTCPQALRWCHELGVEVVTVYAFSLENFKRTSKEARPTGGDVYDQNSSQFPIKYGTSDASGGRSDGS